MHSDSRKTPRRVIRYPGLIMLGGDSVPIHCALRNASQEGAQIYVDDAEALPDEFVLVLGYDGTARRYCRVVWRSKDSVGVEFKAPPQGDAFSDAEFAFFNGDAESTPSA